VVEHSGEHQGRLNIKQHGLIPIEAIARYVSLRAHVQTLSTKVRLDAAATAGVIPAKDALALTEAHDLFWELRLEHQVGQLSRGEDPDDYIDVKTMDPANRRHTRDAFRAVSAVQRSLRAELSLPP
jgi:CBS domain-containing protein